MNWRGRPLSCHEVIVQTIAATTTATGLRVHAELDISAYDTAVSEPVLLQVACRLEQLLRLVQHQRLRRAPSWPFGKSTSAATFLRTRPRPSACRIARVSALC
jgi:Rhodopirellula transposase DDE domain